MYTINQNKLKIPVYLSQQVWELQIHDYKFTERCPVSVGGQRARFQRGDQVHLRVDGGYMAEEVEGCLGVVLVTLFYMRAVYG